MGGGGGKIEEGKEMQQDIYIYIYKTDSFEVHC